MELRELRSFVCIARVGSFSRAATELYIAQPALSRQIAKLEDELGQSLFIRYGRGIQLTEAGSCLLERAQMILGYVEETRDQVRSTVGGLRGQLSVGISATLGTHLAGTVISTFGMEMPGVNLRLREGLSHTLLEWLSDGRIDVAVIQNQPSTDHFDLLPIFSESMMLVSPLDPAAHGLAPLPDKSVFRIGDLSDIPLLAPGPPHTNRRLFEQMFAQYGCNLRIRYEIDSVGVCKDLVRRGYGYAILTRTCILDELKRGELRAVPIENPPIRTVVCIATSKDKSSSILIRQAVSVMKGSLHDALRRDQSPSHTYLNWIEQP